MTAAAAKKKKTHEPAGIADESTTRANGLWIDKSSLPTTLAKKGPPQDTARIALPAVNSETKAQNRLLQLAEIVLRNSTGTRLSERRKRKKKFKGVDRRSTP